ncbi:hypothetical protein [Pseudomonas alabamensis]|uniref:hypothetical protein n=1 Tax=Pseudomonas alabamensis TaxID=3064349 RepID=UPI003F649C33
MTLGTKLRDALALAPSPHRTALVRSAIAAGLSVPTANLDFLNTGKICDIFAPANEHMTASQEQDLQGLADYFDSGNIKALTHSFKGKILEVDVGL